MMLNIFTLSFILLLSMLPVTLGNARVTDQNLVLSGYRIPKGVNNLIGALMYVFLESI